MKVDAEDKGFITENEASVSYNIKRERWEKVFCDTLSLIFDII